MEGERPGGVRLAERAGRRPRGKKGEKGDAGKGKTAGTERVGG